MPIRDAGHRSVHAVGYVRVSTAEQAREGVSLEAQCARIKAHCAAHGLELSAVHRDEGISGRKASNRPGLEAAIREVCATHGVLVVYSLSRLARSTKDAILISERLAKCKAELVLISESVDTTTASGRMFYAVLAALAAFESDLIGERTKLALDHKRRLGVRHCCNAPYGWRFGNGGRIQIHPPEQAVLRRIRQLRAKGLPIREIARMLSTVGIRNRDGRGFRFQQVAILLNRGDSHAKTVPSELALGSARRLDETDSVNA